MACDRNERPKWQRLDAGPEGTPPPPPRRAGTGGYNAMVDGDIFA